ncbi:MAG: Holliday junction resolvase Hjc [Candidatus Micrarchaeota archaeon]|nr:Holliday junction resolvase Hjc [Candidatus Micrarchaeota archaeon]
MSKEKGSRFERQLKKMLEEKGFFVVRASGSGADGVSPDLIALSSTLNMAIECKAWNGDAVYIEKQKYRIMSEWEKRTAVPVFVAWKSPRKEWRFFPLLALRETGASFALAKSDLETGLKLEEVIR